VADGFSRRGEHQAHTVGDGSAWSVDADWEGRQGLANDLFAVGDASSASVLSALQERFRDEPVFREVVDAFEILEGDSDGDDRARQRAAHKVGQYAIVDGKLWQVRGGSPWRAKSRVECVTRAEAAELARLEHEHGGHWGRDAIKLALLDRIKSPRLDQTIIDVI
ncbi:hypothetical protein BDW22DRAFT_1296672, partial [Trametopsis cervina]